MHRWLWNGVVILSVSQYVTSQTQICNQFGCGPPTALTTSDKLSWLNNHNQVRCQANAQTMPALIWDEALEKTAQEWANTCPQGHNDPSSTNAGRQSRFGSFSGMGGSPKVGENYASGQSDYIACDTDWASEKPQMGGHYTQMVWAGTTRVGCAMNTVACSGYGYFYICDYYPAGNFIGQQPFVAASGTNTNTDACLQQNHAGDLPTYTYTTGGSGSVVNVPITGGGGSAGGGGATSAAGNTPAPGFPTSTPTTSSGQQGGSTQQPPVSTSKNDPTGIIVGALIGVFVGIAVIGGLICYFYRRRQSSMKWSSSKTHIDNYQVDRNTHAISPSAPSPTTNNYTPGQVFNPASFNAGQPTFNANVQGNQPPQTTWNHGNQAAGAAPIAGAWSHHQKHPSLENYQMNPALAVTQPTPQQGVRFFPQSTPAPAPMIPAGPPVPSSRPMIPQSRPQGSPTRGPVPSGHPPPYMY